MFLKKETVLISNPLDHRYTNKTGPVTEVLWVISPPTYWGKEVIQQVYLNQYQFFEKEGNLI